jgi:hypothetical protein
VVVIINGNQVAELQVTGHRGGLAGNTLHSTAITEEAVCVVVDQVIARLVEDGGGVSLSNGQTNSVGETLTQRTSGDLDTRGVVSLGVTGSDAINLLRRISKGSFHARYSRKKISYSEALQVVHGDIVTEQVEESVLEHATVAVAGAEH